MLVNTNEMSSNFGSANNSACIGKGLTAAQEFPNLGGGGMIDFV